MVMGYFFILVIVYNGHGVTTQQVGPFETFKDCQQVQKDLLAAKVDSSSWVRSNFLGDCYKGLLK